MMRKHSDSTPDAMNWNATRRLQLTLRYIQTYTNISKDHLGAIDYLDARPLGNLPVVS
jgi:hypothetical protein